MPWGYHSFFICFKHKITLPAKRKRKLRGPGQSTGSIKRLLAQGFIQPVKSSWRIFTWINRDDVDFLSIVNNTIQNSIGQRGSPPPRRHTNRHLGIENKNSRRFLSSSMNQLENIRHSFCKLKQKPFVNDK
jgi:hypothetical protein